MHSFQRSLKRQLHYKSLTTCRPIRCFQHFNHHSTETDLLCMRNDILVNMNKQRVTLLVFLDLSAAFDTVDQDILLQRFEYKFGIKDQASTWFKSYLSNRSQRIVIGSVKSDSFDLKFGVPHGCCLDPMLFSFYTSFHHKQTRLL